MPVLFLGIQAARTGLVLRGSFAGRQGPIDSLRRALIELAGSLQPGSDVHRELETLAAAHAFVVETEPVRNNILAFYFWEREGATAGPESRGEGSPPHDDSGT